MSSAIEKMQRQIELALNEISADQMVFRVTLQCFIFNMARHTAVDRDFLAAIKAQVLGSLAQTLPGKEDPQGSERHKQLTLMRGEQFFRTLEEAAGKGASSRDPQGAN